MNRILKINCILAISVCFSFIDSYAIEKAPPALSDSDFLALPAVDLEWTRDQKASSPILVVGDQIHLKVIQKEVSVPLKVDIPAIPNLEEQGWNIQESPPGSERDIFLGTLVKPGKITLPSLPLLDQNGKRVARTQPFTVEVTSAISPNDPRPDQPEGLEPPIGLQFPFWVVAFLFLFAFILVFALIYGVYFYWKRRKKIGISGSPLVVLPEDEIALSQLEELASKNFLELGNYKSYYFRISEILKIYIGARYRFDACESTTAEIISQLDVKGAVTQLLMDQLQSLFTSLDRVKFTDCVPVKEEALQLMEDAKKYIFMSRRSPTLLTKSTTQTGALENASR